MTTLETTEKIGNNYFTINPNNTHLNKDDRKELLLLSQINKDETFFVYKTEYNELVVY